jgi:hypothetical protein
VSSRFLLVAARSGGFDRCGEMQFTRRALSVAVTASSIEVEDNNLEDVPP